MKERSFDKICEVDSSATKSAMSKDATVSCGLCGAKAHDASNVCDPVYSYSEDKSKGRKTR